MEMKRGSEERGSLLAEVWAPRKFKVPYIRTPSPPMTAVRVGDADCPPTLARTQERFHLADHSTLLSTITFSRLEMRPPGTDRLPN